MVKDFALEAWHINMSNHALNRDDGAYLPKEYIVSYRLTHQNTKYHILEYIDIERTRLSSEISPISKISQRSWSGKLFSLPGVDAHSE
jgi:hypothetical protein